MCVFGDERRGVFFSACCVLLSGERGEQKSVGNVRIWG